MCPQSNLTAREIAERLLTTTGHSMASGDFETFADCLLLPQKVASFRGERELVTRQDVRDIYDGVRNHFIANGIGRVERFVEDACFVTSEVITSTHITTLYKRDGTHLEPYPAVSVLKYHDGHWLISDSQYAVVESHKHSALFTAEPNPLIHPTYGAIFDEVLQGITRAFMDRDFDLLKTLVRLPFFVEGRVGPQLLRSEDDLWEDFELYLSEFQSYQVTDIRRKMQSAQLLNARCIIGTYSTNILSGPKIVLPSYDSSMTLEKDDRGVWRAVSVHNAMGHLKAAEKATENMDSVAPFSVDTLLNPETLPRRPKGDNNG